MGQLHLLIIAQAMNHGNQDMARTSDIPYHVLESTYQQYLRQASLNAANDSISNAKAVELITQLSPAAWRHILLNGHYSFQSGGKILDLAALLDGLELK